MRAEDIVEGLNKHIEDKRGSLKLNATGHLVLQRIVKPHQTFKAYKEYEAILWFIKRNKKYRIMSVKHTAKVLDDQEEPVIKEMNIMLCRNVFNWIGSGFYEQVIRGEYNGDINESVSDSNN